MTYAYFEMEMMNQSKGTAPNLGSLQCFCQYETEDNQPIDKVYNFKDVSGQPHSLQLCQEVGNEVLDAQFTNMIASFSVIGINYALRIVIMRVFESTGCSTLTQQMKQITMSIFVSQFFNTGLLLMLVNANLTKQGFLLGQIFQGNDSDFSSKWFITVGDTLVSSLVLNIYFPAIEAFIWFLIRTLRRVIDRRCWTRGTSVKTRQAYIEIHAGPVFYMHYKYSMILNIIFITFMFGTGMPILFPIATLTFLTLYILEKGMLYYGYREPPVYDEVLNEAVLSVMKLAPLFMLGFGYWFLSSKQLLSNDLLEPIQRKSVAFQAGHLFFKSLNPYKALKQGPEGVLLIFFYIYLGMVIFNHLLSHAMELSMKYLNFKPESMVLFSQYEDNVQEQLDSYYRCLHDVDK